MDDTAALPIDGVCVYIYYYLHVNRVFYVT